MEAGGAVSDDEQVSEAEQRIEAALQALWNAGFEQNSGELDR